MIIYIGADHRGFALKDVLKKYLKENGYEVIDLGNESFVQDDDYPDFAMKVAEKVSADPQGSKGILICGSGVGVDIVANKFPRVRSALVLSPDHAYLSRNDDDTNIICLGSELIDETQAKTTLAAWLQTPYSEDVRHSRRIAKIRDAEDMAKKLW
ncbi:MAG: RpiB/LacA/LacB family sugar-phosphate isomerase [Candidatus Colwellbacteria bacterium]|nr:RpiB/LacA/LacB family sugar-phosphate isomerase [Candidatus Colwellbacteria bacterium]